MISNTNNTVKDNKITPELPPFTIQDLIDRGVHFGHRTRACNPKMKKYIYGEANKTSIIDVRKTASLLTAALNELYSYAYRNKRILFISTNPRFEEKVKALASRCGQYYICKWRGGMLTNWRTVIASMKTLKRYDQLITAAEKYDNADAKISTKKELAGQKKQYDKLVRSFGGILNMGGMPDIAIVFSVNDEGLAIAEANCIGIPIIGIVDTNANPEGVTFPIPGNDNSQKVLEFYCNLFAETILSGMKAGLIKTGAKAESAVAALTKKDESSNSSANNKPEDDSEVVQENGTSEEEKAN